METKEKESATMSRSSSAVNVLPPHWGSQINDVPAFKNTSMNRRTTAPSSASSSSFTSAFPITISDPAPRAASYPTFSVQNKKRNGFATHHEEVPTLASFKQQRTSASASKGGGRGGKGRKTTNKLFKEEEEREERELQTYGDFDIEDDEEDDEEFDERPTKEDLEFCTPYEEDLDEISCSEEEDEEDDIEEEDEEDFALSDNEEDEVLSRYKQAKEHNRSVKMATKSHETVVKKKARFVLTDLDDIDFKDQNRRRKYLMPAEMHTPVGDYSDCFTTKNMVVSLMDHALFDILTVVDYEGVDPTSAQIRAKIEIISGISLAKGTGGVVTAYRLQAYMADLARHSLLKMPLISDEVTHFFKMLSSENASDGFFMWRSSDGLCKLAIKHHTTDEIIASMKFNPEDPVEVHYYSLVQLWFLPYVLQTFTENVVQGLWNEGIEEVVQTKVAQVTHFARSTCQQVICDQMELLVAKFIKLFHFVGLKKINERTPFYRFT